ncbi:MAG: hypothetical protein HYZ74_01955 [Elusimicrobia bacterium]|nr:hypothetical protein [Elusimicrobiota bacterium]
MITFALLSALLAPVAAGAQPVALSTAAESSPFGASTQTVATLYTGDRVRDPFLPVAMGASSVRRDEAKEPGAPEVVDIHAMILRGIMKDSVNDYALFASESGISYLLRAGKLYNDRNKIVPGIAGRIKLKQKTVELITPDKDVQVFRLGEDEKDKEKQ